jgi:hypothetical protein
MKNKATQTPWPALEDLIDNEGQITIGYVDPIPCVAIANTQHDMLAALKRRRGESLTSLLNRLNVAVAQAEEDGSSVDELNG